MSHQDTDGAGAKREPSSPSTHERLQHPVLVNTLNCSLLTDLYQITMAYGYWRCNKHADPAVFDLFFRKCPFDGQFTVFAGLEQVLAFLDSYCFEAAQIEYLRGVLGQKCDARFFDWLAQVNCKGVKVYAQHEGNFCFPKQPLLRVEGPLAICQLLETTLLNMVNYATLVATNAARFRKTVGPDINLFEFGLRRAQGPDGALSASKYTYMGGFDGTSNVLAGMKFGIPVKGTHAHAFVTSFTSLNEIQVTTIRQADGSEAEFFQNVMAYRKRLEFSHTNSGELAAFIAYAQAFPDGFLALVDTYDTLSSGVPNFLCVAAALKDAGWSALGVRLDSGDLAYLS